MKRTFQLLIPLFVALLMLSACGSSLQKPTGLEKPESGQEEVQNEQPVEQEQDVPELAPEDSSEEDVSKDNEQAKEEPAPKNHTDKQSPTKEKDQVTETKPKESPKAGNEGNKQPTKPVVEDKKPPVVTAPPPAKPVEPPAEKPAEKEEQPEPQAKTIVYSIMISPGEVPLPPTEMEINDGDTVLKALINITKKHKIQMDYRGGQGSTAYIEGIANVYEFDRGQGSGWMYRVNGIFPDRGAGVVPLMAGDRVEWLYTTNLGVDLNADLKPFRR